MLWYSILQEKMLGKEGIKRGKKKYKPETRE